MVDAFSNMRQSFSLRPLRFSSKTLAAWYLNSMRAKRELSLER
jgi:hypothetical protein